MDGYGGNCDWEGGICGDLDKLVNCVSYDFVRRTYELAQSLLRMLILSLHPLGEVCFMLRLFRRVCLLVELLEDLLAIT